MIDTVILIDQSYFLQDDESVKSPEEKSKEFMQEFLKAKQESEFFKALPSDLQDEVLGEFLFICLTLYNADSSQLPTKEKLDQFVLTGKLVKEEEETEEVEETEGIELPQGPEEGKEESQEDSDEDSEGASDDPGEAFAAELDNLRRILDGESVILRRDPSGPGNRFF